MRTILLLIALMNVSLRAQDVAQDAAPALSFSRSIPVPMNALQLHDAATLAWNWTFGKEPGAKILAADRSRGTIEGSARLNFRSTLLTGREETMGTVSYSIHISVHAGECRILVSDLVHTGNRSTTRGGIHLKQLMRADLDAHRAGGMSRTNIVKVHAEIRERATQHVHALLQAFEARLRASVEP